jgi:hypothetical protein
MAPPRADKKTTAGEGGQGNCQSIHKDNSAHQREAQAIASAAPVYPSRFAEAFGGVS